MSMRLSLGKDLRHRDSCPSLVSMCPPISSASVGEIRKLVVQIFIKDVILMGYWMVGQVRTIMSSVMCKINLRVGENILRRVIMIPCAVFFRAHLRSARSIALLDSVRGRVGGLVDAI